MENPTEKLEIEGSELFKASYAGDKVLAQTYHRHPWVTRVFTGSTVSSRYRDVLRWLKGNIGREDKWRQPGRWRIGVATVDGMTNVAFRTEKQMVEFEEIWKHGEENSSTAK